MNTLKTILLTLVLSFGVMFAQEEASTESTIKVSGEFSTDFTYGGATDEVTNEDGTVTPATDDVLSFSSPYTGITLTGDGWQLSGVLTEGMYDIEEAWYKWDVTDDVSLTFGHQATPYGIAWGLHRPSNNQFVSLPREHATYDGVGLSVEKFGIGVETLYGNDEFWAGRLSYSIFDHTVGVSLNSDEARLVDVSGKLSVLGFPIENSFEYDLSEEGNGAFWLRSVVTPDVLKGVSVLVGYSSDGDDSTDNELIYGVSYKCTDNFFLTTELSGLGDEDGGDFVVRASYKF
tara:strand:+ start:263 stop:1129 length:867 start_codon:yes stop_codon:yes gene_type:complete